MTDFEILLLIFLIISVFITLIILNSNFDLKQQVEGREFEIRYLKRRIEKDADIQLLYKVLNDLDTIKKEKNKLKENIYLLERELQWGIPRTNDDPSLDYMWQGLNRLKITVPPCNGKTLAMKSIQQQHFEDIVSKMKSEVEERIMNEGKCCDTQPKVEKPICGEDLLDTYEDRKDVIQMFRYFTGYGKDIKALMDFLECKTHEVDLIEGWMTFKEEMNDVEFKVNNGDCIVLTNRRDISVMTYRDFTSKYTKKES